jgi:hypothetical protein
VARLEKHEIFPFLSGIVRIDLCSAAAGGFDLGQHRDEVQLYAFDILAMGGDDLRSLTLLLRKTSLERLLARRPDGAGNLR